MCVQRVATDGAHENVQGYQISEATCVQREAVGGVDEEFLSSHPDFL